MLRYPFFLIHAGWTTLANGLRHLRAAPDYVTFTLAGSYPALRPPHRGWLARRLSPTPASLMDLADRFSALARDPRVRGVVLHLRPLKLPLAELQWLRVEIQRLREAGKHVCAWSHTYTNASLYVASAADEVLLQPGGHVHPLGFKLGVTFLTGGLNKLGLEAEVVQISPYKSGMDVLTRTTMSDEAREMYDWLLDSQFEALVDGLAEGRGVERERALAWVDGSPYTDLEAVEAGLVDGLLSEEALPERLGEGSAARLLPWEAARGRLHRRVRRPASRHVALLRVEGDIVDGENARPPFKPPFRLPLLLNERAGDLTVVQQARRAAEDKRAAALVVYVDSGGGSATASEAMAAALEQVAARKPVVVVMGAVAGSGGYYVATPGAWIVARPGTITGSIGVLNGHISNRGLLDKLGLTRDLLLRGERADFGDASRPLTEQERAVMWKGITRTYDVFLDRVTASRKLAREAVDAVGRGRVWTGRQALDHGLVDALGGLREGVEKARALAGLPAHAPLVERYRVKQPLAPPEPAGAAFDFALRGIVYWDGRTPLCLCPFGSEPWD